MFFLKVRYHLAKVICPMFPPIVAQSLRERIITINEGEVLQKKFQRKSFTGGKLVGTTADFHAFKFDIHGYFEWRNVVIARCVLAKFKKGDIIEVGGNVGTETVSFADIAKKFQVNAYSYEPSPDNYVYLEKLKAVNEYSHLALFPYLVSDQMGTASFRIPEGNRSGSGHISSDQTDAVFEVVTLDQQHSNRTVAFVSIDVEGFDFHVLRGAKSLLQRDKPFVVVEVNDKFLRQRGNTSAQELYDYMRALDYELFYMRPLGIEPVDLSNLVTFSNKNWVCIPSEFAEQSHVLHRAIQFHAFNPFV